MVKWKWAYPVIQESCTANVMGWPAIPDYDSVFSKLKEMGYEGVELLVRDTRTVDRGRLRAALEKHGLRLAAVGTSPMQQLDHLFFLHPEKAVRRTAEQQAMIQLELAGEFHACACIGKFRGSVSDEPGCTWKDLYEVMSRIGEAAARQKVTVVVEPQNPDSINNLNTIGETLNWLSELKNPQVHLLADTFHMEYTEENTAESIIRAGAVSAGGDIGFVHVADTQRQIPGKGEIDFTSVFSAIKDISYQGFISPEIRQMPDSESAARACAEFFRSMV